MEFLRVTTLETNLSVINGFERARLQPRHPKSTITWALAPEGNPPDRNRFVKSGFGVLVLKIAIPSAAMNLLFSPPESQPLRR
jgi:hypothetical protein